jgi:hypothetical protein
VTDPRRVAAARAAWRQLQRHLRLAPITDAQRLADEITASIAELFPQAPPQQGGKVIDFVSWLKQPPRRAHRR